MYQELALKNEKIQQLTIYEERNRIAREIHDSLGHSITGLMMQLDVCDKLIDTDIQKAKQYVQLCRKTAKQSMNDIRQSVMALKPNRLESQTLVHSVKELIHTSTQNTEQLKIDLNIIGQPYKVSPLFDITIYRVIQECITNSVRHSNASRINIHIRFDSKEFVLRIKDNGSGCPLLREGYGLSGMRERVAELGGTVTYDGNDGFEVYVCIPIVSA